MDVNRLTQTFDEINSKLIRNVCIIAHVDHGKTTMADCILSSNGIISARLAGKLRFMDSREDEQERGITMKSSVISLYFNPLLVNLIDSPGHVDFISEVNWAVNVADVALLVVDVVEGVCSQTEALLRQALLNDISIILVINKMDRLVVELKMTEAEAFNHLTRLLENVNSCMSQILQGQFIEETDWSKFEETEKKKHFHPASGNVVFASAAHGWAFDVRDFAKLWSTRLQIDEAELAERLFSDSYLAGGQIHADAERKGKRTIFEQLVLQPIWEVQKCAFIDNDLDKLKAFAEKLKLPSVRAKRMEDAFPEFMRSWLPLSKSALKAVAHSTSAHEAFQSVGRLNVIFPANDSPELMNAIKNCNAEDDFCVGFVVKFFKKDTSYYTLVRVMSGTLQKDTTLFIASTSDEPPSVQVESIHVSLGREMVEIQKAPAGSIVAIKFSDVVPGTTLLSKSLKTVGLHFDSTDLEPLVRVTVRSSSGNSADMTGLRQALKQLSLLDSSVGVYEQEDGDLALVTAGEVHLQKCIQDLADMGLEDLEISEPIVPLLETIVPDTQATYAKIIAMHITECNLKTFNMKLRVRAVPLTDKITKFLQSNESHLKTFRESRFDDTQWLDTFHDQLIENAKKSLCSLKGTWWQRKSEADVEKLFENVWTFGPNRAKFNILFNATSDYDRPSVWKATNKKLRPLDRAVVAGFDLAMSQGVLCDEPCQGIGIILEEWILGEEDESDEVIADRLQDPQLQGQLISATKQTFRAAMKKHPLRLVTPMYKCKVTTGTTMLGKVHTVLSQRRAKVLSEDVNEVNGLFEIYAHMPIVESFSFCEQLRKRTSGVASAQTQFSHWQIIDEDPFWEPTTEEELEEFGVKGDSVNQARAYMNAVRRRKGLQTDELVVVSAEKQRNLKRNK
ncbi:Elongation factor 2 [Aphelenchoides besseyi]|nr:Elongation factor 2 [Aphelenchoides besseyi]